jgi:beta-phosphoglucomutase-like phosphatase (HAD superfamily)
MGIQAIIFDFNGVLVDDEVIHFRAFQRTIQEDGLDLDWDEYCEKYLPYDDHDLFSHFLENRDRHSAPQETERLIQVKSHHYFKAIEGDAPTIQSSIAFVNSIPPGVALAIASGAARQEVEFILDQLDLRQRFSPIITASDVEHGKPHPEAFLKALAGLQKDDPSLERDGTIVIEDSYQGVDSAHQAGLKCVALSTTYSSGKLAEADLVLETLEGWSLEQLAARLEE